MKDTSGEMKVYGRIALGLATICYACFCVSMLRRPLGQLLNLMPDDVYYYLEVARHMARGEGSSFDGQNLTNGYHPGWMALMAICARLVPGRERLLHCCLLAGFALHAGASLVLARVLARWGGAFCGWIGGAFWLLNPLPLLVALQGMEATLYEFALALSIAVFAERIMPALRPDAPFRVSRRDLALWGLSLALVFWGRTEGVLFALLGLVFLAIWIRFATATTRASRVIARAIGFAGGSFVLGVAPWFLYSWAATGSLKQNSGAMKMMWAAREHAGQDFATRAVELIVFFQGWWLSVAPFVLFGQPNSMIALFAAISIFQLSCLNIW